MGHGRAQAGLLCGPTRVRFEQVRDLVVDVRAARVTHTHPNPPALVSCTRKNCLQDVFSGVEEAEAAL